MFEEGTLLSMTFLRAVTHAVTFHVFRVLVSEALGVQSADVESELGTELLVVTRFHV